MPVMGPCENQFEVDRAYEEIMALLNSKYHIQDSPSISFLGKDWNKDRAERNANFKEC